MEVKKVENFSPFKTPLNVCLVSISKIEINQAEKPFSLQIQTYTIRSGKKDHKQIYKN